MAEQVGTPETSGRPVHTPHVGPAPDRVCHLSTSGAKPSDRSGQRRAVGETVAAGGA